MSKIVVAEIEGPSTTSNKITIASGSQLDLVGSTGTVTLDAADITAGSLPSSRLPAGTVLQVVQTVLNTPSSQSVLAATITPVTDLNVSITPLSTSSKFLVSMIWTGESSSSSNYNQTWRLKRTVSAVDTYPGLDPSPGSRNVGLGITTQGFWSSDASSTPDGASFMYLDSPSASTEITYTVCLVDYYAITLYNQRSAGDANSFGDERTISQITVMEISG